MRVWLVLVAVAMVCVLAMPAYAQRRHKRPKAPPPPPKMAMPGTETERPVEVTVARRVSVDDLQEWMDAGLEIRFVDTRSSFTGPKIAGAAHVPELEVLAWSKSLPRDSVIVAYCTCSDEHTSINAVLKLQRAGFIYAYALKGGLSAWLKKSLPTETAP